MSKLIKKINPNDYLKLSTYADKYGVCKRSLYRHAKSNSIYNIEIDGIFFVEDVPYIELKTNRKHGNDKTVKNLTLSNETVKNLTLSNIKTSETQPLTETVQNLTLSDEEKALLNKPENDCSILDFERIEEIKKKI